MSRMSLVRMGLVVSAIVVTCSTPAWARQGPPQPPAELSRVDIVASVPWKQIAATAGAQRVWTGPGFSLGVNGNVSEHAAIASGVEKFAQGGVALLTGIQLSTAFYYGSGRDPVPGRFFAKFLAGASSGGSGHTRGVGQFDVGADVLLGPSKPIGFRWEVGYDIVPGDPVHHAYGRVAIGFILAVKSV